MTVDKMKFTISWEGPGDPTMVQLLDNSDVISLKQQERTSNSISVHYEVPSFPTHHIEWTFTFIGQALSNLKATVQEGDDPKQWPLKSADSAKNQWNEEGYV